MGGLERKVQGSLPQVRKDIEEIKTLDGRVREPELFKVPGVAWVSADSGAHTERTAPNTRSMCSAAKLSWVGARIPWDGH